MQSRRWPVTRTDYNHDHRVYGWRHEDSGKAVTVRITKDVLERYPSFAIMEHFDRLKLSALIRQNPEARLVLVQQGQTVQLEEW
jgi:hypothetical protein